MRFHSLIHVKRGVPEFKMVENHCYSCKKNEKRVAGIYFQMGVCKHVIIMITIHQVGLIWCLELRLMKHSTCSITLFLLSPIENLRMTFVSIHTSTQLVFFATKLHIHIKAQLEILEKSLKKKHLDKTFL